MNDRLCVIDGTFPADLLAQAADAWPRQDWPYWYGYRGEDEAGKLTCAHPAAMPVPCQELLELLATGLWPLTRGEPDPTFHGAGMHSMLPGSHLGCHLDASHHPKTGLERTANAILFVGPWQAEWGGELELWGTGGPWGEPVTIQPLAGRLVLFRADDRSLHGVREVTCPPGECRKSLALYWYAPTTATVSRPRARFMDQPGEVTSLERERRRLERAGMIPSNGDDR